ncbi:unnamed protein product [Ilex paraguariensis]|uniref:BSD domain-containing protein n=1 Tax=Ilex paraguariensis TaxID=185542 RepID=A0ABC8ST24_9AQUA
MLECATFFSFLWQYFFSSKITSFCIFLINFKLTSTLGLMYTFSGFQMTEKEFWTKYSRAEYLHSTKIVVVAAAEAAEDDELAVFLKQDDMAASEARRKVL